METDPGRAPTAELLAHWKRTPIAIYGPKIAIALFVMSVLAAITKSGQDRWGWVLFVAISVAAVAPFATRGRPRLQGAAMVFKFLVGAAIGLAGVAGCVVTVVLVKAGSYGLLAAMIVAPVSFGALVLGWSLAFVPSPARVADPEKPPWEH